MNKIKKTILALSAVLVFTPAVSTVATNSTNNFSLTLSQATQRAVQTNRDLRTLAENITLAELARDEAQTNRLSTSGLDMQAFISATAALMTADVNMRQSQLDQTIMRDTLEFYVMDHFAAIHMAEAELVLFDQELAVMDADLAILSALVSVGFAATADYNLATAQRDWVAHNRQNLSRALDAAHLELNRLIGAPANRRHTLVFELPEQDFEPLVVTNMQGLINHQRQTHSSVEQARRLADIEWFRLTQYQEGTIVDPMTGHIIEGMVNPLTGRPIPTDDELRADVGTAGRAAADARDAIERHIQDQYAAIRRMEQDIESLKLQVAELESNTHILQTRIEVGEILAVELQRHNLAIAQRQQELDNAILAHNMAVIRFRSPNVSLFL